MYGAPKLVALAATFSSAMAAFQGFNYGSTWPSGAGKTQADFEAEFTAQRNLPGTNGVFTSARLYTMIQAGTANTPISALQAAANTKTSLLLGLWCSAGDAVFANELQALKSAIAQYGSSVEIAGISVGSEDLYRISPTGIANKEFAGAGPQTLANYIQQVKAALAGTPWSSVPVGHVDTWTVYVNGSNKAVIDASDFIGVDAYPYFQSTMDNQIKNSKALFDDAVNAVKGAVGGKPIWITETGFPTIGKASGAATPSTQDAKAYWDQVYCAFKGQVNIWWYTLLDAGSNPSFGVIGSVNGAPLYDLSCKDATPAPPASSPVAPTVAPTSAPSSSTGGNPPPVSSSTAVPTIGGGSPGAGNPGNGGGGAVSSSSIPNPTTITNFVNPTGGVNSTGAPGGTGTGTTPRPSSSPPVNVPSAAAVKAGSIGAAFLAVMAAILTF